MIRSPTARRKLVGGRPETSAGSRSGSKAALVPDGQDQLRPPDLRLQENVSRPAVPIGMLDAVDGGLFGGQFKAQTLSLGKPGSRGQFPAQSPRIISWKRMSAERLDARWEGFTRFLLWNA